MHHQLLASSTLKTTVLNQANSLFTNILQGKKQFNSAVESYKKLNSQNQSFTMGPGVGLPQTVYNTAHTIYNPLYMKNLLYEIAITKKDPYKWLKQQEWYALTSLPQITCNSCKQTVNFESVAQLNEKQKNFLLLNMVDNLTLTAKEELTVSKCPFCGSNNLIFKPQRYKDFTTQYQKAMEQQFEHLDIYKQLNNAEGLPVCRLSIEIADILQDESDKIDSKKLQDLSQFVGKLKNPLLFIHHYTNPAVKPHLFEKKDDIAWFAHICQEVIKACPNVTHVCPISQPMALVQKVSGGMQPPFSIKDIGLMESLKNIFSAKLFKVRVNQFIQNVAEAQKQASIKMKQVNPRLKVLVSHQWKPMKPLHTNWGYQYIAENYIITPMGSKVYNQDFVDIFKQQESFFDGIALSIYRALYFDIAKPIGDNTDDILDPHASLEAIVKMNEAFPNKPIYIVEAGLNSTVPQRKREFINMLLHVCSVASSMNIPVKTCFFWGLTNDIYFYREWNKAPGSTHFGFYETLNLNNPTGSITPYGKYFKEIIASVY